MAVAQLFSWNDPDHLGAPERLIWGVGQEDLGPLPMQAGRSVLRTQSLAGREGRSVEVRLKPLAKPQQTGPRRLISGAGAGSGWNGNLPTAKVILAVGSGAVAPTSDNPLSLAMLDGPVYAMALQIQAAMRQESLERERTQFVAWCRVRWIDPAEGERQTLYTWSAAAEVSARGDAPVIGAFSELACIKGIELWAAYPISETGEAAPFAISAVDLQSPAD
jgi:hypothetical protein